jgi:hypothetical protein
MAVGESITTVPGLRRNAIGLREVLFQSITDMAPGAAIAASIPAGVAFAGGSLPLAVIFALVACLFCACSIGLLAREMPSAGSLATYAARGLHPSVGFLVAWGYVLVGFLIPPLVLLQLRLHHRGHDQRRVAWLPGEPVVAVGAGGRPDRARGRLLRRADVGTAGDRPGPVRDRGVPRPCGLPARARRQPQHGQRVHHQVHAEMGPGVAGFMILGVVYLIYLYRHDPPRVVEVGLVHLDALEEDEP